MASDLADERHEEIVRVLRDISADLETIGQELAQLNHTFIQDANDKDRRIDTLIEALQLKALSDVYDHIDCDMIGKDVRDRIEEAIGILTRSMVKNVKGPA